MEEFVESGPRIETCWRGVILLGRNTASYKFALGKALLEFGKREQEVVWLEELAAPFAEAICEHLKGADKQATSRRSQFLDACRQFNQGALAHGGLISLTAQIGFRNVLDAFHVVGAGETPVRFFLDERNGGAPAIRLTEPLFQLATGEQESNLAPEVEARWRLVETAWEIGVSRDSVAPVVYDPSHEALKLGGNQRRRPPITGARNALSGYQKGQCFYCGQRILLGGPEAFRPDVDHFIERRFQEVLFPKEVNLDGVWNLTLACRACNRGVGGKMGRIPALRYLERLVKRNNFLIISHHPLRDALIQQTGQTPAQRRAFLQRVWNEARSVSHEWQPQIEAPLAF